MTDPAPRTRTQEKKAASRTRILHEAAAAIRRDGTERISVQGVMQRAGMTVGGFYAHFASKDDLLAQAIAAMFEERYAWFLSDIQSADPAATLGRFVDSYLSMRHRETVEQGCPIPALAGEIGRLPDAVREQFVRGMDRLTHAVEQLLVRLSHPDPQGTAGSAVAEMTGAIGLARVQPDADKAAALLRASRSRVRDRLGLGAAG